MIDEQNKPEIRRQFVDIDHGQIHYRYCGDPANPPVILLHGSPGSSYSMIGIMKELSATRFVMAFDLPGNGDSTPVPKEKPQIADIADGVAQGISTLCPSPVDIYGWHTGGTVCIDLSIRHSALLSRIVLDGVSVFSAQEREILLDGDRQAPDIPVDYHGTQFQLAWTMVRDSYLFYPWWARERENRRDLGLPSAAHLHGEVMEVLKANRSYFKTYRASIGYPKRERLPQMKNPVLAVVCPSDQLVEHLETVARLVPAAQTATYPGLGRAEDIAQLTATMLRFFDQVEPTRTAS